MKGVLLLALAASTACAARTEKELQAMREEAVKDEQRRIDKLVQFTASDHSAILFDVGNYIFGYAKEGRLQWIYPNPNPFALHSHATLSHDGKRVAYAAGDAEKPRHIMIYDIPTARERELLEVASDPGEMSWSWDDAQLVYYESGPRKPEGISAVSVRDGATRLLVTNPAPGGWRWWIWRSMQWLHNNKDLVVELTNTIPVKESYPFCIFLCRSIEEQSVFGLFVVSNGGIRQIDMGRTDMGMYPSVSPVSDRIAYADTSERLVAVNADGTGRAVLVKATRSPPFFLTDGLGAGITWSSDGSQLLYLKEGAIYRLDLDSGRHKMFLPVTGIRILGWH